MEVMADLGVNGDNVCPGTGELLDLPLRPLDHEVDIEGQARPGAKGLHNRGADGYLGDEMPIHDIDMDIVSAGASRLCGLLPQPSEVSREDGWSKLYLGQLPFLSKPFSNRSSEFS